MLGSALVAISPSAPAPLPPWAKLLLKGLPFIWALGEALVDTHHEASDVTDVEWRKLVLRFTRSTPAGSVEDQAQIAFNILNLTGGQVDKTWTTADYTTCEAAVSEWFNNVRGLIHTSHTCTDFRWYRMAFSDPMSPSHRFAFSGPPQRVTPFGGVGAQTNTALPYQDAMTATLDTGVPRHWGRFYLPGLTAQALGTPSRWINTATQTLANGTAEFFDDLYRAEFQPVVPVTQVDKALVPALLTVAQVRVDDIPDVIRRRRPKQTLLRTVGVPTP